MKKSTEKSRINLFIDIILLLFMMLIAGIGLLIRYVLVPGPVRAERYGSHTDLELWGMDRHEWGSVHFTISIIFLGLLVLHIILHWKMIVGIFRKMIPNRPVRVLTTLGIACLAIILLIFPMVVKPEILTGKNHQAAGQQHNQALLPAGGRQKTLPAGFDEETTSLSTATAGLPDINGSQTLQNISEKYRVPVEVLAADLNIPSGMKDEKLGRLRRKYSFSMEDVRNSIVKNRGTPSPK